MAIKGYRKTKERVAEQTELISRLEIDKRCDPSDLGKLHQGNTIKIEGIVVSREFFDCWGKIHSFEPIDGGNERDHVYRGIARYSAGGGDGDPVNVRRLYDKEGNKLKETVLACHVFERDVEGYPIWRRHPQESYQ